MKRLLLAFVLLWPVSLLADFQAGTDAYERKDYGTAYREWLPLAKQGNAVAQFNLGVMYDNGTGVRQDNAEAVRWYRLAAKQGHASAQFYLGLIYDNGRGVPENDTEAVKWYRLAAEQDYAEAQVYLGLMYVKGEGVRQDYYEAVRLFRLAADQGDADAQASLGVMYDNGTGVPQDYSEAIRLYGLAAAQGNAVAQYNLGDTYYNGRGVPRDYSEAARWFRKAADQGDADAQAALGFMYAQGLGVQQSDLEAMHLYGLAAKQGNAVARYNLVNDAENQRMAAAKRLSTETDRLNSGTENQQIASLPPRTEEERELVRRIQKALTTVGYYDGSIDGIAGPVTRAGIRAFQQEVGLPVTGKASKEIAGQLDLVIAAVKRAQESSEPSKPVTAIPEDPKMGRPVEMLERVSTGTGFVVDDEGRVLTNRHVVKGCEAVKIVHSGRSVTADFIQPDTVQDFSLIEAKMRPRSVAVFRSGRGIRPGETVYAYGFPLQGLLSSDPGITAGNVSNLAGIRDDRSLLQITAPVQPGNSGGPLLDESGNVVGVVVGKLNSIEIAKRTGDIPQNVNFAINATEARKFLDANGIEYETAPSEREVDAADIAAKARRFTVLVECWR